MSDGTTIEWTDGTVNAINGCMVLSPGCKHCYAMKQAHRFEVRRGLTQQTAGGMVWTGEVRFNEKLMLQPLGWTRPRRLFWNAHGDTFYDAVPVEMIDRCFAVMALAPQHSHQVLTKRSARMRDYINDPRTPERIDRVILDKADDWGVKGAAQLAPLGNRATEADPPFVKWPLPNVWLGVSVEDQKRAEERIPDLLATPAAVRWLSCEPMLGPIDLTDISLHVAEAREAEASGLSGCDALSGIHWDADDTITGVYGNPDPHIDWVVAGGESGPGARPMHPDWVRALRDQCHVEDVPFLFKQWGEHSLDYDRDRDDPDWRQCSVIANQRGQWINLAGGQGFHGDRVHYAARVGKKAAGRLLDGVEHNGYPA